MTMVVCSIVPFAHRAKIFLDELFDLYPIVYFVSSMSTINTSAMYVI